MRDELLLLASRNLRIAAALSKGRSPMPGPKRTDPRFPDVDDILAHQANFFEKTIAALRAP